MRMTTGTWAAALIAIATLFAGAISAQAADNEQIRFQGRLLDNSGTPITVTTDVEFNLYTVATAGTSVWDETHSITPSGTGVFTVLLGTQQDFTGVDFSQPLYLGVTADPVSGEPEMAPRYLLSASSFAHSAGSVGAANVADGNLTLATGNISLTSGTFTGDGSGLTNVTASSVAAGDITGTIADTSLSANVTLMGNAFNGADQLLQLDNSGNLPALDGSALTGLTTGQITGLGSLALQNANNVNISGGTIDGTTIGAGTAAAGTFTTVSVATLTATSLGGNLDLGGFDLTNGGTITATSFVGNLTGNADTATTAATATDANALQGATWDEPLAIGGTTASSGAFTTLSTSGLATLDSLGVTNGADIGLTGNTALTALASDGDYSGSVISGSLTGMPDVFGLEGTASTSVGTNTVLAVGVNGAANINQDGVNVGALGSGANSDYQNFGLFGMANGDRIDAETFSDTFAAGSSALVLLNTLNGANDWGLYVEAANNRVDGDLTVTGALNTSSGGSVGGTLNVTDLTVTNNASVGNALTANSLSVTTSATVTGSLTAADINTGQGVTEVYLMDQNVQTGDNVTFNGLTISTNGANVTGPTSLLGNTNINTSGGSVTNIGASSNTTSITGGTVTLAGNTNINPSGGSTTNIGNTGGGSVTINSGSSITLDGTNTTIQSGLTVQQASNFNSSLGVASNLNVGGSLTVAGAFNPATINTSTMTATTGNIGQLNVSSGFNINAGGSMDGTIGINAGSANATTIGNGGNVSISAANWSIDNAGNAGFGGTLGVTGAATLSSTLGVAGAVTADNGLTVNGAGVTVNGGNLALGTNNIASVAAISGTGNWSTDGNISTNPLSGGTITSDGALTVNSGGAAITGNSSVSGALGVTGTATFGDDAAVPTAGALVLHDNAAANTFTGTLQTAGTLGASRTWTLPDNDGTVALLSDINTNGSTLFLRLDGTNSMSGTLTANNNATLSGAVNITGTNWSANDTTGDITATSFVGNLTGNADTATTATNFSGSLAGDVTGTQGTTTVSQVGSVTAANVASGATLANNATDANTASTIVRRDASGNFTAGTITAAFVGNLTGTAGNATQLNGQPASFYLDAGNLTGTLDDARLSGNVALLNAASNTFTGDLTAATLTSTGGVTSTGDITTFTAPLVNTFTGDYSAHLFEASVDGNGTNVSRGLHSFIEGTTAGSAEVTGAWLDAHSDGEITQGVFGQAWYTGAGTSDVAIGLDGRARTGGGVGPGNGVFAIGVSGRADDENTISNIGTHGWAMNTSATGKATGMFASVNADEATQLGYNAMLPNGFRSALLALNPTAGVESYGVYVDAPGNLFTADVNGTTADYQAHEFETAVDGPGAGLTSTGLVSRITGTNAVGGNEVSAARFYADSDGNAVQGVYGSADYAGGGAGTWAIGVEGEAVVSAGGGTNALGVVGRATGTNGGGNTGVLAFADGGASNAGLYAAAATQGQLETHAGGLGAISAAILGYNPASTASDYGLHVTAANNFIDGDLEVTGAFVRSYEEITAASTMISASTAVIADDGTGSSNHDPLLPAGTAIGQTITVINDDADDATVNSVTIASNQSRTFVFDGNNWR